MPQLDAHGKRKSFLDVQSVRKYPAVEQLKKELEAMHWIEEEKTKEKGSWKERAALFLASIASSARTGNYKVLVNALALPVTSRYAASFSKFRRNIEMSDINMAPETYVALALAASLLSAFLMTGIVLGTLLAIKVGVSTFVMATIFLPPLVFVLVFAMFYFYPDQIVNSKKHGIDTNLPFATTHMAAIASSGIPPENIFRLLVKFSDYGWVSIEARNIVRRIDSFGEDLTTAIHHVAQTTPSKDFKELLYGILSIVESGGNLKQYLKESASIAMFNYELARKKYTETLSTFADIYTALLIAAPLFLVSILVVINIVPDSRVGGLPIDFLLKLSTYVIIPGLNVLFLMILSFTQPEV